MSGNPPEPADGVTTAGTIEKGMDPRRFERRWYEAWLAADLFRADAADPREPFCIVIPPPNITGSLHVGHALNAALQDIVVRWRRMQGRSVLWLPGTDHASIATQLMVERQLAQEGIDRKDLGREKFLERTWRWKEEHAGIIRRQLEALGASCDWSRERFTMDPGLSRAVREVFVRLHEEGLIYRAEHMISWCPRCRTAISDLEVVHREVQGKLWRLRYPLASGAGEVIVATTRPETMLGDTAVAVHPEDERYAALIGQEVLLPVSGRRIPIVADRFVDPAFGTGAVKVTPAHDPNDFEIGRRHQLPSVQVIGEDGRMTAAAGPFAGQDRFAAREALLVRLRQEGALASVQEHTHAVGHCQRCDTVVEPAVSPQWFVRIAPLAAPAIAAVENEQVRMFPESWRKTYFEWMRNIHDWCISRQLWWGHRIPAYYCDPCGRTLVAREEPPGCLACGGGLRQDPDVLDTWFSSALWPFSTLGWPDATADLQRFYPGHLLVTGPDIIFFWVARMIMAGLKFTGEPPFAQVYFTGLVRDAEGNKMSKTRGNVVDPMELIDLHGADAVRFTLASQAFPGSDIPLDPKRLEGYRAFGNKLWNATRFVRLNLDLEAPRPPLPAVGWTLADRWILSGVSRLAGTVTEALEGLRFDEAAAALYQFTWHRYCDWYVELAKDDLRGSNGAESQERARGVLVEALDRLLRLLHPFMPFLTEELAQSLPGTRGLLPVAEFPGRVEAWEDPEAEALAERLIELDTRVRNVRAQAGIPPSARIRLWLMPPDPETASALREHRAMVAVPVRASEVEILATLPEGVAVARGVGGGILFAIPLAGVLDLAAERARLTREIDKARAEREPHARKVESAEFLERAPERIIERTRQIVRDFDTRIERLAETLALLGPG